MQQKIINVKGDYKELDEYLKQCGQKKLLLVCGRSIDKLALGSYFETLEERLGIKVVRFSDFKPNPLYESVVKGVELLHQEDISLIVAVGGGSAMDVAKCIKLYANMDPAENYLKQKIVTNEIGFIAAPTTAGTGSEATRYAVIYYNGEKQSVADYSGIPSAVVIDPAALKNLPVYQKKVTMLDALCHSIESLWSVNSTEESQGYSKEAIRMILENMSAYLENSDAGNANMLKAANLAGKAINITQTTAGHAMCYKLTSLYGLPHGHAAALCVSRLFPYMLRNMDKCIDKRGSDYLKDIFQTLAETLGEKTPEDAVKKLDQMLEDLGIDRPVPAKEDFAVLDQSVNVTRLKNHPIELDIETIDWLYHQILSPVAN